MLSPTQYPTGVSSRPLAALPYAVIVLRLLTVSVGWQWAAVALPGSGLGHSHSCSYLGVAWGRPSKMALLTCLAPQMGCLGLSFHKTPSQSSQDGGDDCTTM